MFTRSLLTVAVSLVLASHAHADNLAAAEQYGNGNKLDATQFGTALGLTTSQSGTNNEISSEQTGQRSEARLTQQGEGNYQSIYQFNTYDEYSGNHRAVIDQVGAFNTANVVQLDDAANSASINQDGNDHRIDIQQSGRVNDFTGYQGGVGNQALIIQEGGARAEASQSGTGNSLSVEQTAWPFGASMAVSQSGEFNVADIVQTAGGRYPGGRIELDQDGQANNAEVAGTGAWSVLEFTQTGNGNELAVNQSGRNTRIAGTSSGDYNRAEIDQTGDNNVLDLAQSGSDNLIQATQGGWWGQGDIGTVAQTGNSNFASLTQNVNVEGAATNIASILQNGSNNSATVVQGQ